MTHTNVAMVGSVRGSGKSVSHAWYNVAKEIHANAYMTALMELHKMSNDKIKVYQVGGSLLPHKANDYDLVIWDRTGTWDTEKIKTFWEKNYLVLGFSSCEVYVQYHAADEEDAADEEINDDGSCKVIVKLESQGVKFDLLYAIINHDSIYHWMLEFFPLSCQCVAKDLSDSSMMGEVNVTDIVSYYGDNRMLRKYYKYYPTANYYLYSKARPVQLRKNILK